MNTVMKMTPNGITINDNDEIVSQVMKSLCHNNTFCPNIKRVIYNIDTYRGEKSHRKEYTLATTVFFADGTKTTVKNSIHDKVDVTMEKVKLSDGSEIEVETASRESKEVGLVYAIVKRLIGEPDENGTVGGHYCTFLNKTVTKAFDQPIEKAKNASEEKIRKSKKVATKKKSKDEQPSLRRCVQSLTDIISKLDSRLNKTLESNKSKK
jgi:hypothetical protein